MKNDTLALILSLASVAAPAMAQEAMPSCASTNFDSARNLFTVMRPAEGAPNQQCFLTVLPRDRSTANIMPQMAQYPQPYLTEGNYAIDLSGGGGGGGGGSAMTTGGGGGGGAGAPPFESIVHLSPGVYKLTIGRGGRGGWPDASTGAGRPGDDGSPTGIVNISTGQTVAGFDGADRWTSGASQAVANSAGAPAISGGGPGGSGGVGRVGRSGSQTVVVVDQPAYYGPHYVGGMDTTPFSPSLYNQSAGVVRRETIVVVPGQQQAYGRSSSETMMGTTAQSSGGGKLAAGGGGGAAVQRDSSGRIVTGPENNGLPGGDGYIALKPAPIAAVGSESVATPAVTSPPVSEPAERPMKRDRN